jgi:predicted permease
MRAIRAFLLRLGGLFHKGRRDREMAEEIESNLQFHIEDNLRAGMSPEEARREAILKFGGVESAKEAYRDRRGLPMLEDLAQDTRYALRMLRTHKGFSLAAVITIALGIGANTAMFSFLDAAILKPLGYRDPERLVMIWHQSPQGTTSHPSPPTFFEWRAQNQVFSHLSGYSLLNDNLNLTGRGEPEKIHSQFVSANYFDMMGAQVVLGRAFNADEDQIGRERVVILSHRFWQRRFGADPKALGESITLNDKPYTVIGVLPATGVFARNRAEVWLPMAIPPEQNRPDRAFFLAYGRLKPGVTLEQARAEMNRIAAVMDQQGPPDRQGSPILVEPLRDRIVGGDLRKMLWLLAGATIFILLITSANVANLLLARGAARQQEIAIRAALGASRMRISRQCLTESLLLAALGGVSGLILAHWSIQALISLMPPSIFPDEVEIGLDYRMLLFTLGLTFLTGIVFGLAPAWQAAKFKLTGQLHRQREEFSMRLAGNRSRSLMLVVEIASAIVLLIGSTLMIRSFARLLSVDPGFPTEQALSLSTNLAESRYPQSHQLVSYQAEMLSRLRSLPGVKSAAATNNLPLGEYGLTGGVFDPNRPQEGVIANLSVVSTDYFTAMGIKLQKGRYLSELDNAQAPRVVVLNQALARRLLPEQPGQSGEYPLGQNIEFTGPFLGGTPFTVVGVVNDTKPVGLDAESQFEIYVPYVQAPDRGLTLYGRRLNFIVRSSSDPVDLAASIRSLAMSIDEYQPISDIKPMEQLVTESVARPLFHTMLFAIFGSLALVLAAIGIFGVIAYTVTQRTHEIGIRMALGAQAGDVFRLVMRQGLALALAGIAAGLPGAYALTRLMSTLLFEVSATDSVTFVSIPLLMVAVALLACWIPARRATKVDPLSALRRE